MPILGFHGDYHLTLKRADQSEKIISSNPGKTKATLVLSENQIRYLIKVVIELLQI